MSEKTYEMLWDCQYCGSRKNLGKSHRHCPSCGAPQDPAARYFPPDNEKIAVEDHHYVGADLLCPACSTANSRNANNCGGCGSPLDGAKAAQQRGDRVVAEGQQFQGETSKEARSEFAARQAAAAGYAPPQPPPPAKATGSKAKGCAIFGILGFILLLIIVGGGVCAFNKCSSKSTGLEVAGHSWVRAITIEKYASVEESDWCDKMPAGAEEVSRSKEKRSTKKVEDGEDCKIRKVDQGDGTFKEKKECSPKYKEEPVYDSKCRYRVRKWKADRTEKASGSSLEDKPRWPELSLGRTGTCDGCERKGESTQTYTVRFLDTASKKEQTCDFPDEAKWSSFKKASKWTGSVGGLTGNLDCDSLKPVQ